MAAPKETPDIETSSEAYASRFMGRAGAYMLEVQEQGIMALLDDPARPIGDRVLDLGGGHAQLAGPMAATGFDVTVLGSDESCGRRLAADPRSASIAFQIGDLLDLPYADRSFDALVSVRLISHIEDWPRLVAQMCRVTKSAIIIDYPAMESLNILSLATFGVKKAIEKNTRTYRSFWASELRQAFAAGGFAPTRSIRQFALPMALHRLGKGAKPLQLAETALRRAGVTALLGNPVLLRLDRVRP